MIILSSVDKIFLNGLVFFGRHGCHAAENELGQKFVVDIELECDLARAGQSDDLNDTIDYVNIYNIAKKNLEGATHQLLESVAQNIAEQSLADEKILAILVRITKPHIALPGTLDGLGIEIYRRR